MAKKPRPVSLFHRSIGLVKRNPWRAWPIIASTIIGIPGLWASAEFIDSKFEPWYYVSHGFFRTQTTDDHTYIVYLKQRDARQSLKEAKSNLVKNPNDSAAQRAADYYEWIIKVYQRELDKAAGN